MRVLLIERLYLSLSFFDGCSAIDAAVGVVSEYAVVL